MTGKVPETHRNGPRSDEQGEVDLNYVGEIHGPQNGVCNSCAVMSGTADPWEPPASPALLAWLSRTPTLERSGGPERIYDKAGADKAWTPRAVGFTAQVATRPLPETDVPLTWEGDDA